MYRVFQRRPLNREKILESWLEDYKKIGTQLASARPSQISF